MGNNMRSHSQNLPSVLAPAFVDVRKSAGTAIPHLGLFRIRYGFALDRMICGMLVSDLLIQQLLSSPQDILQLRLSIFLHNRPLLRGIRPPSVYSLSHCAINLELHFLCCLPQQTVDLSVIWDAITIMLPQCNEHWLRKQSERAMPSKTHVYTIYMCSLYYESSYTTGTILFGKRHTFANSVKNELPELLAKHSKTIIQKQFFNGTHSSVKIKFHVRHLFLDSCTRNCCACFVSVILLFRIIYWISVMYLPIFFMVANLVRGNIV